MNERHYGTFTYSATDHLGVERHFCARMATFILPVVTIEKLADFGGLTNSRRFGSEIDQNFQ